MNKDIKFRVWHKDLNMFLPKEEYCLDLDGKLIFVEMALCSKPGDFVKLIAVNPDLYTVQQWTGLKDKNGKDIYEGDIVLCPCYGDEKHRSKDKFKIYYGSGYFGLCQYKGCYGFSICGKNHILEVIGNIFENKELLEK